MYKQIIVLCLVVAVVNSEAYNSTYDYLNLNRRQFASNIKDMDLKMETFEKIYNERINTINTTSDILEDGLQQNDERLNPLEILSDFSRKCVTQYRSLIPTIASVKTSINTCIATAKNQIITLLASARITRNNLDYYYSYNYESYISNCNKSYKNYTQEYINCLITVTSDASTYTITTQKTFATQMDTAECSGNANIKKALECSFTTQNRTISLQAQANTLIDRCLQGLDNCGKNTNRMLLTENLNSNENVNFKLTKLRQNLKN